MLEKVIDGVIVGYDGLSQTVSYRPLQYAGEGAVSVFFPPKGLPPTQGKWLALAKHQRQT